MAATVWADRQTAAVAKRALADAYRFVDDHQKAVAYGAAASQDFRSLNQIVHAAQVEAGYIASLVHLGEYEQAHTIGEQAAIVIAGADDPITYGRLQANLGILSYRLGRLQEADNYFSTAKPILEQANQAEMVAMLLGTHASIQIDLDLFDLAQHNLLQARTYFEAQGASTAVARANSNIAYLLYAQGDYQQAMTLFDEARAIFEENGSAFDLLTIDLHRSEIYLALNLWYEALKTIEQARALLASSSFEMPWEEGRLWLNEGVAFARSQQSYSPSLARARDIFKAENNNKYWLAIADLYEATFLFRDDESTVAYEKAAAASISFAEQNIATHAAKSEILLGNIALGNNQIPLATEHFNNAQQHLATVQMPALSYAIQDGLGRIEAANGNAVGALSFLRRAMDEIEQMQGRISAEDFKIAYLVDKMQVYDTVIQICLEINTPESRQEAFTTVERAKSRVLLDRIERYLDKPKTQQNETLIEEIQEIRRDLGWYYNRLNNPQDDGTRSQNYLATLNQIVNQKEHELRGLLQRLQNYESVGEYQPIWTVTVDALQELLPSGTLLLEYYTLADRILVFGVTANAVWNRALPIGPETVQELLSQLRFQMNKFSYGERYRRRHAAALKRSCDNVLQQLYDGLFAPLLDSISAENVVVIPHGLLHYVPFHALYDGTSYLVDQYVISYAPSATLLSHTMEATDAARNVTAPRIVGLDDPTIPYAQDEAKAIAQLFPEANLFVGEEACLRHVISNESTAAFLHLSTHALFRSDNATFSSLKFQDGWLNVHDIYEMVESPELVTLSACETGRHQVLRGDELMGLCRGFFATGARSLVVSLWMVEDQSAADLMTEFYKNLQLGLPVSDALRNAQQHVKQQKPHPYYWAPFVLTGNMDTQVTWTN